MKVLYEIDCIIFGINAHRCPLVFTSLVGLHYLCFRRRVLKLFFIFFRGKKENRRQIKNKIRPESALSIELESDGSVSPNTSPRCKSPTPSSSPSGSGRRVPNHLNFGHKLPMRAVSSLDHMKDLSAALDHHATENA